MARPRKDGMDYFPHDVDASIDEKIEAMRSMFGNDGYAFYFIILERIYRSGVPYLDLSKDIFCTSIASKIMVNIDVFHSMIDASIDVGLFDESSYIEHQLLTSSGIKKRFDDINLMRDKWRNLKETRAQSFLNGKPEENSRKTERKTPQSKAKESKAKESKAKEIKTTYAEFVRLHDSEYESLVKTHGEEFTNRCIETLDNYKGQSGTAYKSDYRAILNWVIKRVKEDDEKATRQAQPSRPQYSSKPAPDFSSPKPTRTATGKPNLDVASAPVAQPAFDMDELLQLATMLDSKRQPGTLADMTYAVTEPLNQTPKENDE